MMDTDNKRLRVDASALNVENRRKRCIYHSAYIQWRAATFGNSKTLSTNWQIIVPDLPYFSQLVKNLT